MSDSNLAEKALGDLEDENSSFLERLVMGIIKILENRDSRRWKSVLHEVKRLETEGERE